MVRMINVLKVRCSECGDYYLWTPLCTKCTDKDKTALEHIGKK